MNEIDVLKKYLTKKIGMKPDSLSDDLWKKIILDRMKESHYEKVSEYIHFLESSETETQNFIEKIIVPETWFFRDRGAFDCLTYHLKKQYAVGHNRSLYRVLSVPCSTGEEPYSIVMTLIYSGLLMSSFEVNGVDISYNAIDKARRGRYKKNSFRTNFCYYQKKYFTLINDEYVINDEIKNKVSFFQSNILCLDPTQMIAPYDAIFCRNLFIYLDHQSQYKVFEVLETMLKPTGILFVAPAEIELVRKFGYQPVSFPKAYAFVKEGISNERNEFSTNKVNRNKQTYPSSSKIVREMDYNKNFSDDKVSIEQAEKYSNEGNYESAQKLCLKILDEEGGNAKVYFILGQIYYSQSKKVEAESCFLKALYLNPKYYEALVYLSIISSFRNDFAQAELYKKRAEKAYKYRSEEIE